jgi:hypothetical protein
MLEDVFHRFESGLEELGRFLFKPDPHAKLRAAITVLTDDLSDRHEALRNTRKKLKDAHRRLENNQQAVVLLSSRIEMAVSRGEGSHGYHLALEVDRLRQEIAEDRVRVPRYEQAMWSIEFKIRQKVRELARLQEQLHEAMKAHQA